MAGSVLKGRSWKRLHFLKGKWQRALYSAYVICFQLNDATISLTYFQRPFVKHPFQCWYPSDDPNWRHWREKFLYRGWLCGRTKRFQQLSKHWVALVWDRHFQHIPNVAEKLDGCRATPFMKINNNMLVYFSNLRFLVICSFNVILWNCPSVYGDREGCWCFCQWSHLYFCFSMFNPLFFFLFLLFSVCADCLLLIPSYPYCLVVLFRAMQ